MEELSADIVEYYPLFCPLWQQRYYDTPEVSIIEYNILFVCKVPLTSTTLHDIV